MYTFGLLPGRLVPETEPSASSIAAEYEMSVLLILRNRFVFVSEGSKVTGLPCGFAAPFHILTAPMAGREGYSAVPANRSVLHQQQPYWWRIELAVVFGICASIGTSDGDCCV